MAKLFEPLTIKSITFKNRIIVSPMCQYSSQDGFTNDWHLVHLGSRAIGGAAAVIMEATAVSPEGRITYGDAGIWKDEHVDNLQRITRFITEHGAVAGIQLAHAGRKASCEVPWKGGHQLVGTTHSWQIVAPSPIPFKEGTVVPQTLSIEDIEKIIIDFKHAAKRALSAGFRLIEIHAAHGYLINEFLSPLSNQRTDEYGGSFENRIRLLVNVIQAIKSVWPEELPLFVRISASDWVDGGWTIDDSVKLAKELKLSGVDLMDCSSGGLVSHAKVPLEPGYQVPFAEKVKHEAGILTGAVGLITNAEQAEKILQKQEADVIILAREFLRDPYFALHAAKQLGAEVIWPVQYERAKL
ncbi:MAG: NADPH dehydrogenase NamA [Ferruginibacter sp.]